MVGLLSRNDGSECGQREMYPGETSSLISETAWQNMGQLLTELN